MPETALDITDFKNAMARFPSGVTVATTHEPDGTPTGFTATAFSSLSLDPPLVLVCLEKKAGCYPAFMAAKQFAISILASEQGDLAWKFASRGADKFAGTPVELGTVTGMPLIAGASVQLECQMHGLLEGGDHTIIVGEVVRAVSSDTAPMLHYNRKFGVFRE